MTLRLYNTLTRRKQEFRPLDPENVRMYVCGPTVYDFAHIGNARPVVVFDVLFRLLRHVYGADHVTYVRNITDVDDKINARAAQDFPDLPLNEAIGRVTEATERQFHADVAALGCLSPTVEPRATGHIDDMKQMIERLVERTCAYVAEDHVLFRVAASPEYGVLANRSPDEMLAGARVEVAPYKRDAMDFVLWKPSKPGEPAWASPCGIEAPGRPGWHIECSAMSWRHLGETFDVHGGGIDLLFPHHENELAQSRCALGVERMAQVWMHNGFLQVEGRKMAKSEGNFVTIRDAVHDWDGLVVRFALLMTHYRKPMDWSAHKLREASRILESFKRWYDSAPVLGHEPDFDPSESYPPFLKALCDDLNTPDAIAKLHVLVAGIDDSAREPVLDRSRNISMFSNSLRVLGFDGIAAYDFNGIAARRVYGGAIDTNRIELLIAARNDARNARSFAEADRIRDELEQMGIIVKDNPDGTTWEVKR